MFVRTQLKSRAIDCTMYGLWTLPAADQEQQLVSPALGCPQYGLCTAAGQEEYGDYGLQFVSPPLDCSPGPLLPLPPPAHHYVCMPSRWIPEGFRQQEGQLVQMPYVFEETSGASQSCRVQSSEPPPEQIGGMAASRKRSRTSQRKKTTTGKSVAASRRRTIDPRKKEHLEAEVCLKPKSEIEMLAGALGLDKDYIQIWFCNRRQPNQPNQRLRC